LSPAFVDTNVLLYSIERGGPRKRPIAIEILQRDDLLLSVQVLQELIVQAANRRKAWAIPFDTAAALVRTWRRFPVIETSSELFERSLAIRRRYRFHYWDSAILAAACLGEAGTLLTEDLPHGQIVHGVQLEDPFCNA